MKYSGKGTMPVKSLLFILAAFILSGGAPALPASVRISDPASFVAEVYRNLAASGATGQSYLPPEHIYTARLAKLFQDDKTRAKGEVGCLDFVFWVNGQDWTITSLSIANGPASQDRKVVIAKFLNIDVPEEIHFDFQRIAGRWLLDDVHSVKDPRWTLSDILKCTQ
jgi:hypothetical protein